MTELSKTKHRSFLDIFPTPQSLMFSNAGVSITDRDTKYVELRKEMFGDGFKLIHSSQTINPEGAIASGGVANASAMTEILKSLSRRFGTRFVRATLPEEKAYLFTTNIDIVPRESMRDAVAFILEENAPVSLAESVFDFDIVCENKERNQMKVSVAVLPKDVVESYVKLFESAGITPISFDLESQAIASAVIARGDKMPQLIINLSGNRTGFYVAESEFVQFSSTSSYGTDGENPIQNANDLREEVYKVLAYWNSKIEQFGDQDKRVKKIVLCGSGTSNREFTEKLLEGIDITHESGDVWVNLSSVSKSKVTKEMFEKSIDYAPAIGLALSSSK